MLGFSKESTARPAAALELYWNDFRLGIYSPKFGISIQLTDEMSFPLLIPWTSSVRVLKTVASIPIIAIDKPRNVLSHPNSYNQSKTTPPQPSIIEAYYDHVSEAYLIKNSHSPVYQPLWLLHRLDSPTSGLMILSSDESTAKQVKILFKKRKIAKTYIARVFGHYKNSHPVTWSDDVLIARQNEQLRMISRNQGDSRGLKRAVTEVKSFSCMKSGSTSLLELMPQTGFTHQLRYQCATRGWPIVGDDVYGDFQDNKLFRDTNKLTRNSSRLFLHSNTIKFEYSIDGRPQLVSFESPIPTEFFQ